MASIVTEQPTCKVRGCRYRSYHTTIAHRCGKCNSYGHGQIECNNNALKQSLLVFIEDQMSPDQFCTFNNCTYPWSHSSPSHHCFRCGERGNHSAKECRLQNMNIRSEEHVRFNYSSGGGGGASGGMSSLEGSANSGGGASGGMSSLEGSATSGSSRYYLEGGPENENVTSGGARSSLEGSASKVNDQIIHKRCPICRDFSSVDLNMQLYTGTECSICLENKKKIIFSKCKHASVCPECAVLL